MAKGVTVIFEAKGPGGLPVRVEQGFQDVARWEFRDVQDLTRKMAYLNFLNQGITVEEARRASKTPIEIR